MGHQLEVLRRVLASRRLRRVGLAFLGFGVAEIGVWVVVLVFAYHHGGTTAAGVIAAVQLLPAAITAPLAARLIDSRGAAATLLGGYLAQAASLGAIAALALAGAPSAAVYAAAVVAASAVTLTRPAQCALLPALVETPGQLTAANAVLGWVENVGLLAGPAIASVMLTTAGSGAAFTLFALVVASSAIAVVPLHKLGGDGSSGAEDEPTVPLFESLRRAPGAVPALGVMTMEYAVLGALDVLEVVLAARVLGLGANGAGYLGAVFGIGGLVGAGVALALVGRRRMARPLLLSSAVWGAAFIALGAQPALAVALCLLAVAGASRTVLDVGGRTILHRRVPSVLHGRVFGALEGLEMFGLAVGSVTVPLLVALSGPGGAVIAVGVLVIASGLLATPALRAVERGDPSLELELAAVCRSPLFAMLGPPVLEDLARALRRVDVPAGEVIVREGDVGDLFFLVVDGELGVTTGGVKVQGLGPGDGFGEIALLRAGIRVATVTSRTPTSLYALQRAPFLEAVTGSRQAHRAAGQHVADQLAASAAGRVMPDQATRLPMASR